MTNEERGNFQTRDASGEIRTWARFDLAYHYAITHPDVWKISFGLPTGERIRLVRVHDEMGSAHWVLSQMADEIAALVQRLGAGEQH